MRTALTLLLWACLLCLACSAGHLLWVASAAEQMRAAALLALVLSSCRAPRRRGPI